MDAEKVAKAIKVIAKETDMSTDDILWAMDDFIATTEAERIEEELEKLKD